MKRHFAWVIAAGAALFLSLPAAAQDAARGQEYFMQHCATCHGIEGTGNGPMASVLLVQPSDLTTLSERNDGAFPVVRVVMRIDGRDPLVSHGSLMPVYGQFFQQGADVALKAQSGQPILTSGPIADLVTYLRDVQGGS